MQILTIVSGASAHIGRWAKIASFCGEVVLQAAPTVHGEPGVALDFRTYSCEASDGKVKVPQLCC